MKKIKKYLILMTIFLFLENVYSGDPIDPIVNIIKSQIETNSKLEKLGKRRSQRFISYYNPYKPDLTIDKILSALPDPQGSQYLKEDPSGIFPNFKLYDNLLTQYNNMKSNLTSGKVRHYVCIVDIAPAIYGKENELNSLPYPMEALVRENQGLLSRHKVYKSELKHKFSELKKKIDSGKVFDYTGSDGDYYISIFVIDRQIRNRLVVTSVEHKEIIDNDDNDFKQIINEKLEPNLELIKGSSGVYYINGFIKHFIKTFHGELPGDVSCSDDNPLNLSSNAAAQLMNMICDHNPNWSDMDRYALLRSVMFLEFIDVFKTNDGITSDVVNPEIWKDYLYNLLSDYYDNFDGTKYAIWLKNHKETHFENIFRRYYHEVFYNIDFDMTGTEAYNYLLNDFYINIPYLTGGNNFIESLKTIAEDGATFGLGGTGIPYAIFRTLSAAERITTRYKNIMDNAMGTLFTDTDRNNIKALVEQNRKLLYDFYFNPAALGFPIVGFTATQCAESTSLFLQGMDSNSLLAIDKTAFETEEDYESSIPRVYIGSSNNFDGAVGCTDKVVLRSNVTLSQDYNTISFKLTRCNSFGYIEIPPHGYYEGGYECVCTDYVHIDEAESDVGFFDYVFNVIIENPSLINECNPNCNDKVIYEHAFVTLTRIREKKLNTQIQQGILFVEIVSLPFDGAALVGATGLKLAFRGIIFLVNLEGVVISLAGGGDDFVQGCKNIFGEEHGEEIAQKLSILNAVVGFGDIGSLVGSQAIKAYRFSANQIKKARSAVAYLRDVEKLSGAEDWAKELTSLDKQLKNILEINGHDPGDVLDYYKFYGIENVSGLHNSNEFQRLIIKYRLLHKTLDKDKIGNFEAITDILFDGLNETGKSRLISHMNNPENTIVNELLDAIDDTSIIGKKNKIKKMQKKAKAYNKLLNSNIILCD